MAWMPSTCRTAGRLRAGQGRFEDAHEHLRRGHDAMEGVVDPQYHVPLAQVEALLALWEHRPEDARRAADRVIEVDRLTWWADLILPLAAWAEADLAQRSRANGDRDAREEAERRIDHLLDTVHDLAGREHLGVAWSERLRGAIVQIEAERTRAHGDDDPEAWRRAMAWATSTGRRTPRSTSAGGSPRRSCSRTTATRPQRCSVRPTDAQPSSVHGHCGRSSKRWPAGHGSACQV
jgi:hypothetical protein